MSVCSQRNIGCAKLCLSQTCIASKYLRHNLFIMCSQQWLSMPPDKFHRFLQIWYYLKLKCLFCVTCSHMYISNLVLLCIIVLCFALYFILCSMLVATSGPLLLLQINVVILTNNQSVTSYKVFGTTTMQQKEAKMIWQRLYRMTPRTLHAPPQNWATWETDRQTDAAIIGNNGLHIMHSMQPWWAYNHSL